MVPIPLLQSALPVKPIPVYPPVAPVAIGTVLFPTTRLPPSAKLTGVPPMVISLPPADMIVPSTEKPAGAAVKVSPPTVKTDCVVCESVVVLLPIISLPDGPRLIEVPSIVNPAPPAESVVPSIEKAEGLAVNVWLPTVKMGGAICGSIAVLLPMTSIPEWPRLMTVPDAMIPVPPAEMEVPSMAKADGFAVKIWPPTVKIEGLADGGEVMVGWLKPFIMIPARPSVVEANAEVLPLITTAVPEGARLMGVP